jgi:hypothetical protein
MEGGGFLKNKARRRSNKEGIDRISLYNCIIAESVQDSRDLASYIKARRGPAGSSLIISYNHTYTKTKKPCLSARTPPRSPSAAPL